MAKAKTKNTVTKDTLLADIITNEKMLEVLYKLGVPCVTCPLMGFEASFLTLGQIAETYGLDLEKIIDELKKVLKQEQSKKQGNKKSDSI